MKKNNILSIQWKRLLWDGDGLKKSNAMDVCVGFMWIMCQNVNITYPRMFKGGIARMDSVLYQRLTMSVYVVKYLILYI
jgi:hypothetical protein